MLVVEVVADEVVVPVEVDVVIACEVEIVGDEPPARVVVDEASLSWRLYELTSTEPEP